MAGEVPFSLTVHVARFLPPRGRDLHAILTVTADDPGAGAAPPDAAEVILVDRSLSMSWPPRKIAEARRATGAAIDVLRPGSRFAVVGGNHEPHLVYPAGGQLAITGEATAAEAKAAVDRLEPAGGTAIGSWLDLARRLVAPHPGAVRHVLLLTDGRNEHEEPRELDRVLRACRDRFVCDARGIGEDWDPRELRRITSALNGAADAARLEDLTRDFRQLTRSAMAKVVADVRLRIEPTRAARFVFLRQTFPRHRDLSADARPRPGGGLEVSTGSWAVGERRTYHLRLDVDPQGWPQEEDILAARVQLVSVPPGSGEPVPCGPPEPVAVHWTADLSERTELADPLSKAEGQHALTEAIDAGGEAYASGQADRALRCWGRAARLAHEIGNEEAQRRLGEVVEILDWRAEEVRYRPGVSLEDVLRLCGGSDISQLSEPGPEPSEDPPPLPAGGPAPDRTCPECAQRSEARARFCAWCGAELGPPNPGAPL